MTTQTPPEPSPRDIASLPAWVQAYIKDLRKQVQRYRTDLRKLQGKKPR